ncbi:hypothetical protein DRQ07_02855 [candidate division KSB1 bacterium]|nr:MAG: hypothetical protein DRQ07_02855 [candidate division KSB1 bacterium]
MVLHKPHISDQKFQIVIFGLSGIMFGVVITFTLLGYFPGLYAGVAFFVAITPLLLTWHNHAKKILVAILVLSMVLIIDKTINVHPLHQGGAKGFVISMHDITLMLILFILFIEAVNKRRINIKLFPKYTIPLLGLIVMSVLSMSRAVSYNYSFYELIEIVKACVVFLFLANYCSKENNYKFVIIFIMIGLGIEIFFVVIELITGSLNIPILGLSGTEISVVQAEKYYRAGGTFGGANGLAWYLDVILPLALALTFYKIKSFPRFFSFLLTVGGIGILISTFSRGGWAGFLIGAFIVLMYYLKTASVLKKILTVILVLMIISSLFLLIITTDNPVKDRLTENDKNSAYVRIPLMEIAFAIIRANPVFGVGLNNYTLVHQNYDFGVDKITHYYPVPVHNFLLQFAAETGLPGLFFFLCFVFMIIFDGVKYSKKHRDRTGWIVLGIIAGSAGFFIQGMVENTSLGSSNVYSLWVLLGTAAGIISRDENKLNSEN